MAIVTKYVEVSEQGLLTIVNRKLAGQNMHLVAAKSKEDLRQYGHYYLVEFGLIYDDRGNKEMVGDVIAHHVSLGGFAALVGVLDDGEVVTDEWGGRTEVFLIGDLGPSADNAYRLSQKELVAKDLAEVSDEGLVTTADEPIHYEPLAS